MVCRERAGRNLISIRVKACPGERGQSEEMPARRCWLCSGGASRRGNLVPLAARGKGVSCLWVSLCQGW